MRFNVQKDAYKLRISSLSVFCGYAFVEGIAASVGGGYRSHHAAGDAACHHPRRDVACHHAPRADDCIVAYGHAREHCAPRADPDVVAHRDGLCHLHPVPSEIGVGGMLRRGEAAIGRDEHVVAEGDLRPVRDDEVMVGVKAPPHLDVVAVVAPKGRREDSPLPHLAEKLANDRGLPLPVAGVQRVEPETQVLPSFDLPLVGGVIAPLKIAIGGHDGSVLFHIHLSGLSFIIHRPQPRSSPSSPRSPRLPPAELQKLLHIGNNML